MCAHTVGMARARSTEAQRAERVICGERICRTREALGITQSELAARLGVHYTTIGRWEWGLIGIGPHRRQQIAAALECDPTDLFPPALSTCAAEAS